MDPGYIENYKMRVKNENKSINTNENKWKHSNILNSITTELLENHSFNNNIFNFNLKDDIIKQDIIWLSRVFQNFGPAIDISKLWSVVVCENKLHRFDERV